MSDMTENLPLSSSSALLNPVVTPVASPLPSPLPSNEAFPPILRANVSSDGNDQYEAGVKAIVGRRLTLQAFSQLSGSLGGYPFVKVVVERETGMVHFLNNAQYAFHAHYFAENLLKVEFESVKQNIDEFNQQVYLSPDRKFFLGILALHKRSQSGQSGMDTEAEKKMHGSGVPHNFQGLPLSRFFTLETVEIDNMDAEMLLHFFKVLKEQVDPSIPLLFKPANHLQESIVSTMSPTELPRIFSHELFSSARYIALNPGSAMGRMRAFRTEDEYRRAQASIDWHDIIVMHRVPDDIPRVSGIINAHHTTPLSHTNVLASGWQIPNAIQIGIFDRIDSEVLNGQWVNYTVTHDSSELKLERIERPNSDNLHRPAWSVQNIKLEEPVTANTPILPLDQLRMSDRYKYGTKAANLGELRHILDKGSERLLGFYRIRRPPRANLLSYLAKFIDVPESSDLARESWNFLRNLVQIPRGIAIPFSVQQEFLESSPRIQQAIGKLKMALELDAREIDSLCLNLQQLIRTTRMPDRVRNYIDAQIANHLSGVSCFVVRSSSNAEDLDGFSAAGIYESINHVTTAENIFLSIKEVWGSLLSPRSVRLRQQVGISLDDCYMGVIVQEEVEANMGGVLVTTNPMNRGADFRNVYVNVSTNSVTNIVQGSELPYQYLFNTVEGGGRTLSIGEAEEDLSETQKQLLQKLAFAGRLLQSHFSPDYTFSMPVDIEWVANPDGLYILQLRPYSQ